MKEKEHMTTSTEKHKNMRILVTGGLGFIGFNALQLWKSMRPEYKLIEVNIYCKIN